MKLFSRFAIGLLIQTIFIMPSWALPQIAEIWTQVSAKKFNLLQSLQRSQGLTNDGQGNFWFSANQSLIRTNANLTVQCVNNAPFNQELRDLNANHIGDIDYFNGKIYAPIEDGRTYHHPVLGVYNAQTLQLEHFAEISRVWLPDGIPWVAVDGANNFLITAQYSLTTKINFYDLTSFLPVQQLALSQMLNSIQGGKMHQGFLYVTANNESNTGFAVYKINLFSGEVRKVASIDPSVVEVEGLAFTKQQTPTGTKATLQVLGLVGSGLGKRVNLFEFVQQH